MVGVLALALLLAACGASRSATLDSAAFAPTQASAAGLYRVHYRSAVEPVPLNTVHEWTLRVEDAAGNPVSGAAVSIDAGMPEHNHGMPTRPQVVAGSVAGEYRVEGMKFQMPGRWLVTVTVTGTSGIDTADFNLLLK